MPVWVFCMIFCWGVLFIVLPVKIYQVYLFIYCPIWCRFSPSISLSNLGYVFHISIFSFVTSSWESINFTAFPSVIQTARAWGLQRGSICWNHSYKDTWARPPAQTAVVEATHMSPTKDLKLHTQDMSQPEQWSPTFQATASIVNTSGGCKETKSSLQKKDTENTDSALCHVLNEHY